MAERFSRGGVVPMFSGVVLVFGAFLCGVFFRASGLPRPTVPPNGSGIAAASVATPARVAQAQPAAASDGGAEKSAASLPRSAASQHEDAADDPTRPTAADDTSDAEQAALGLFDTVFSLVKEYYVDPLPGETNLSHSAVRAMLVSLGDPNSYFLTPTQRTVFENEAHGRFAGIGAHIALVGQKRDGLTEHKIVIVSPIPGGAAANAGLRAGDVVTHIDDKWILGADPFARVNKLAALRRDDDETVHEDAAPNPLLGGAGLEREYQVASRRVRGGIGLTAAQMRLRQSSGSGDRKSLRLTIARAGRSEPFPVMLPISSAATAQVPPFATRPLDDRTEYVRLPLLNVKNAAEFAAYLAKPTADGSLRRRLVLDLRGTAGGEIEAAQTIYSLLTGGGIFAHEWVAGGRRITLSAPLMDGAERRRQNTLLVVLVNGATASTGEALAAALRDAGVATLAGEKTFGDASVQTMYTLKDDSAFVLTTGRLISLAKVGWEGVGIAPSVPLSAMLGEEAVLARARQILAQK